MSEDYYRPGFVRIRGREVPWSGWWGIGVALTLLVVLLTIVPVPLTEQVDPPCGGLFTGLDSDYCAEARGDRWSMMLTVTALAVLVFVVGQHHRRDRPSYAVLAIVTPFVAMALWLLMWPVSPTRGWDGSCGSPVLTSYVELDERYGRRLADCAVLRSNRLARAVLVLTIAVLAGLVAATPRSGDNLT